ncbi:Ig-like domain-containing protein [Lacrimispora sp. BS-2]|uniref:Ig-like domain-containing protein n=1 Tax=Lacrimispora sp. BS-2 TaxID=3151850 RepID=A0AAU7PUJ2_9FIRM
MIKLNKRVITIFIMALILNLVLPVGIAKADTNTKYLKVNQETLEFKEIIYIDSSNGNDTSGTGSKDEPFQSIKKGIDYLNVNCRQDGAIIIKDGTYDVKNLFGGNSNNLNADYDKMKFSLFAETMGKVKFDNVGEWMIVENSRNSRIKVKLYGIIFNSTSVSFYHLSGDDWMNEFYNCVFPEGYGGYNAYVKEASAKVENSLFIGLPFMYHYTEKKINGSAVNCGSTTQYMDPCNATKTNALYNVTIDSDFNITSTGWQNAGKGTNPDGTKAHIGVYGGLFAWGTKVQEINPSSNVLKVVLEPNEQLQLSIDHNLSENLNVNWASSNPAIASVDSNGVVTALAKGNAKISAKYPDGTLEFINVLIIDDASDYRLAIDLKIGQSSRLTIDDYTFTKSVTWTIMDNGIATISNKGKVTAVGEGLTLANAKDDQGKVMGYIYIRVRN